jgi:tetratricopeptide (TPR) repeat protein
VAPLSNIGNTLLATGGFVAARPYLERAVEIARRLSPPEDFVRIGAEINLATLDRQLGLLDEAEAIYRSALERFEARLGTEHQATARARALLGMTLAQAGEVAEGEASLRAALTVQRDPERGPMSIDDTLLALGRLLIDRNRPEDFAEAESLLTEALSLREDGLPDNHGSVAEVRHQLALLADARGRPDPALAAASTKALAAALPADDFRRARSRRLTDDGP